MAASRWSYTTLQAALDFAVMKEKTFTFAVPSKWQF
jgi:hypothetical protein